ncbi:hypothetical protein NDU88_000692 [Pleurodeles waltl]|uniref:Uncharacterized protein n=1 Tax=Pleurodeles waltl TaxID=8319 RepID=A0AAV7NDG5_PLEWA|nr:hypothetical protein NDU88_000692 [Pleurodeles waltl]
MGRGQCLSWTNLRTPQGEACCGEAPACGRTGTGGHQPSPQERGSQAKAQLERETGVPAGLGQQRRPTEWSFRADVEMCWVKEGDSTQVPGLPDSLQDLAPPNLFHSGQTAGAAQAARLLGLHSTR